MRIAFLVFSLDDQGGTAHAVTTQAAALTELDGTAHDVHLVSVTRTADRPHFPIPPGVTTEYVVDARAEAGVPGFDRPSRLVPTAWDAQFSEATDGPLAAALRELRADVVVTTTPALLALAAQFLPAEVTLVHQEHRSSSQRLGGMEPLLAFAPRADVVALLTEDMAAWLRRRLGPVAPEVVAIPNALPAGDAPRSGLDQPLIVSAGRLAPEKQWPRLVAAFAEIAADLPDWRLRIFGEGPTRGAILRTARRHGVDDRVELPGSAPDLRDEFAHASIVALTSRSEGFPLVVQEAMAAGVPVASVDCASGPRAIIEHEVNGLLVTPDSSSAMAAALYRLATDEALRRRLGAAALTSTAAYDAAAIAARWVGVFERAVARHGMPRRPSADPPDAAPPGRPPDVTPARARHDALSAVVAAASASGGDWFVVPPHAGSAPVVVVPSDVRREFLAALDAPSYLRIRQPEMFGWPERCGPVPEQAADLARGMLPSFVLEPWPDGDERPGVLGRGCEVRVELWHRRVDGDLGAPWRNRWTWRVPPGVETIGIEVEGMRCRTVPLMSHPTVTDVRVPVDLVYTWVDGSDPVWGEARAERLAEVSGMGATPESSGRARFEDRDELRHSLRSVHLFAPWVRTIHLVTAGQTPPWLDTSHPRVRIVDHREILPAEALPTFNSQAIETGLHRIPGLSEHFVYLNDDMFLARPVAPELFFDSAGRFAAFLAEAAVGLGDQPDLPSYLRAATNNRRLLQEAFGLVTTQTMAHAPYPLRVSVLAELEARFPEAWSRTARSPFRGEHDLAPVSSLAQHYGLLTGSAILGTADAEFLDLSVRDVAQRLDALLERRHDVFCLGDQHDYAVQPARLRTLLAEFLTAYFPIAAPWELDGR
jgi:glycosyltransferase involved in cell wall biosynthesis